MFHCPKMHSPQKVTHMIVFWTNPKNQRLDPPKKRILTLFFCRVFLGSPNHQCWFHNPIIHHWVFPQIRPYYINPSFWGFIYVIGRAVGWTHFYHFCWFQPITTPWNPRVSLSGRASSGISEEAWKDWSVKGTCWRNMFSTWWLYHVWIQSLFYG